MKVVHIFNWNMSQSINYDKITVIGDSYAKNVSIILLLKNIQLDLKKEIRQNMGLNPCQQIIYINITIISHGTKFQSYINHS